MRLNRPKHIALLTGLCLVIFALALIFHRAPREPVYGEHPISYWFNQLPPIMVWQGVVIYDVRVGSGPWPENEQEKAEHRRSAAALAAIRAMGTNGLPFLIRKLGRRETPPIVQGIQLWVEHVIKRSLLPNRELERAQAVAALLILSPLPPNTVAQINKLKLTNNRTNRVALSADYLLGIQTNSPFTNFQISPQFP